MHSSRPRQVCFDPLAPGTERYPGEQDPRGHAGRVCRHVGELHAAPWQQPLHELDAAAKRQQAGYDDRIAGGAIHPAEPEREDQIRSQMDNLVPVPDRRHGRSDTANDDGEHEQTPADVPEPGITQRPHGVAALPELSPTTSVPGGGTNVNRSSASAGLCWTSDSSMRVTCS